MGFFSLLFGNDVRVMEEKNVRVPFREAKKTPLRARVDSGGVHPKGVMKTPMGLVPLMSLRRFRGPKRPRLHSVVIPANQDRLSLWSLLLCQPEVYDPHVEAAPLPHLLDVNKPHVVVQYAEQAEEQQQEHAMDCTCKEGDLLQLHSSLCACRGVGGCAGNPAGDGEEGHSDAEDAAMSSSILNASSDVDAFTETDTQGHNDESDAAESLLHPHTFRVFDTRRCRVRTSIALPSSTSVATFTPPLPCGSVVSSRDTAAGSAASSCGSVVTKKGRLISRKELAKKRLQMRQQSKEAAKRAREYKKAWAALVASAGPYANGAKKGEAARQTKSRLAEDSGSPRAVPTSTSVSPASISSYLTNEALELLRADMQSPTYDLPVPFLARLGHYTQVPKKVRNAAEAAVEALAEGSDGGEGCCSFSSDSSSLVAVDDDVANVEMGLPVMHGSILKCRDSAVKSNDVGGGTAPSRPHRRTAVAPGVGQREPAGKYPLGSRAYVELVLFAQRRQQECALLTLLTEAHRQAREAHLRLAQLYYYYIIPILAQYSTEDEISGLERSLLQCGSGALRMFHKEFCFTTVGSAGVQPVDYQLAEYRFEKAWRELFLEVKTYLGMQAREDASYSDSPALSELEDGVAPSNGTFSTSSGSVCVAATVLHSMELFERQRHTHSAARDAEEWLAWYYYYFVPHVQRATSADEHTAILLSLLPPPPPLLSALECETETKDRGDESDACANEPKLRQPHPLENEYLPLSWTRACDTTEREKVLGYRRDLRMRVIERTLTGRSANRAGSAAASGADHISTARKAKPTSVSIACSAAGSRNMVGASVAAASSGCYALKHVPESGDLLSSVREMAAIRMLAMDVAADVEESNLRKPSCPLLTDGLINRQNYGAAEAEDGESEETEDEDDSIPIGAHQTVNVGCFGLSFFSIFD